MGKKHALAVAQTCPRRGDVATNLAEHLQLVRLAAERAAEIVLFPELSLTGYELDLARELAFSERDARIEALQAAATAHSIVVVAGAPLQIGAALHIASFILQPSGTPAIYTKQRLGAFDQAARIDGTIPPPEPSLFTPGRLDPLLSLAGGPAAFAICADIGLASHPRHAAERGATSYLASMFVIRSDFASDSATLRGYAREHHLNVALANFGNTTGGLIAAGRSSLWSHEGELLAQLPASGSGIAIARQTPDGWQSEIAIVETTNAL